MDFITIYDHCIRHILTNIYGTKVTQPSFRRVWVYFSLTNFHPFPKFHSWGRPPRLIVGPSDFVQLPLASKIKLSWFLFLVSPLTVLQGARREAIRTQKSQLNLIDSYNHGWYNNCKFCKNQLGFILIFKRG